MLYDYMQRSGLGDRIDIPSVPHVPEEAIRLLQQHAEAIIDDCGFVARR